MQQRDKAALMGLLLVASIGALAVVLAPGFSKPRPSPRQLACISNLKQTALAMHMYASDNDDQLPHSSAWVDGCMPYLRHGDPYGCPNVPSGPLSSKARGHAFNSNLSWRKMSAVPQIDSTVLLFESTNLSKNASDPLRSMPTKPRHADGNPVVYVDAHAKVLPR